MLVTLLVTVLAQGKPAPGSPKHRPEEYEFMLQKTGFTLPGSVLEADLTLGRFELDDPDVDLDQFVVEAAFGVTDWLTVEAELPFLRVDADPGDSESGIGDIALEAKASLKGGAANPIGFIPEFDVAAGVRLTLPTGDEDEGLGEEEVTLAPFVAGSWWIERWIAAHAFLGVEWQEDRRPVHRVNATAEFAPWSPELSLFAGLQVEREGSDASAVLFIPGAEYRFPGIPLSVGASLPIGVNDRAPDWGFLLNAQYRY